MREGECLYGAKGGKIWLSLVKARSEASFKECIHTAHCGLFRFSLLYQFRLLVSIWERGVVLICVIVRYFMPVVWLTRKVMGVCWKGVKKMRNFPGKWNLSGIMKFPLFYPGRYDLLKG